MNLKLSILSPLVALALGACDLPTKNLGEANTETGGDSTTATLTEGGPDSTTAESTDGGATDGGATTAEYTTTAEATDGEASTAAYTDGESTDGESTAAFPGTTTAEMGDTESGDTEENPGEDDFVEMGQCALPVVCEPVTQKFAEGDPYQWEDEIPGLQCVWAGLRDGTPGRYTWITSDHFGNGNGVRTHVIHVHADRKVTFAVEYDFDIEPKEESWSGFEPAKTCTLAEPAFFDNCVQNLAPGDGDHDCASAKVWWTDCVEDGPKCE